MLEYQFDEIDSPFRDMYCTYWCVAYSSLSMISTWPVETMRMYTGVDTKHMFPSYNTTTFEERGILGGYNKCTIFITRYPPSTHVRRFRRYFFIPYHCTMISERKPTQLCMLVADSARHIPGREETLRIHVMSTWIAYERMDQCGKREHNTNQKK